MVNGCFIKKLHTYENLFYYIAVTNFFPRKRPDQMANFRMIIISYNFPLGD